MKDDTTKSGGESDPQLLPVDSELLSTMVSTGLMTEAEQTDISDLFMGIRNTETTTKSGGASKEADSLRSLVKRAYTVGRAKVVDGKHVAGNDGDADVTGVINALKSFM